MTNSPEEYLGSEVSSHSLAGSGTLEKNYMLFSDYLGRATKSHQAGRNEAAALYAEIAAYCATWKHAGLFASKDLEDLLVQIGTKILGHSRKTNTDACRGTVPKKILHVATWVSGLQGLNRFLWRWIKLDSTRQHSLVVTGHGLEIVPDPLKRAVTQSGGRIVSLDPKSSILARASTLRSFADASDLVALHLQTEDVVPVIAFSDSERSYPVIFVNNADHAFWVGVTASDLVVNLRESGRRLSRERRGISDERNALLPILLPQMKRRQSQREAKAALGLGAETVLLLSIARAPKYKPLGETSFPGIHVPILQEHPEAALWVCGPTADEQWAKASEETGGRVKALGPVEGTQVYYEAADIYVDSFPIVSITSLLEAGSLGLPLLSRFPFPSECAVLGADTPALERCLMTASSDEEYLDMLGALIGDVDLRRQVGQKTAAAIRDCHSPEIWSANLEKIYAQASMSLQLPRSAHVFPKGITQIDLDLPRVYREVEPIEQYIYRQLGRFPPLTRLSLWFETTVSHPYLATPPLVTEVLAKLGIYPLLRTMLRTIESKKTRSNAP